MNDTLEKILNALREEFKALFQLILEDDRYGTNEKVGINTLKDSNLHNSVEVVRTEFTYDLYAAFYLPFVESGRKPLAKRVPIGALIEWIQRKGISNDVKVAYAIQNAIFREGIKARPITPVFEGELDTIWEEWSEKIFDGIIEDLTKYFNE